MLQYIIYPHSEVFFIDYNYPIVQFDLSLLFQSDYDTLLYLQL